MDISLILVFSFIMIGIRIIITKLDKILNAQDKSRSVTLQEEDGNKCSECGSDTYVVHNCTNEKCWMHSR